MVSGAEILEGTSGDWVRECREVEKVEWWI